MPENTNLLSQIRDVCPKDEYEIGVASLEGLQHEYWKAYPYGIAILKKMDIHIIAQIADGPNLDYMSLYNDTNDALNKKSYQIAKIVSRHGIDALAVPATDNRDPVWQTDSTTHRGILSHKMVATQAGLGWIGKTALLISHRFGPAVRLATVLTQQPVSPLPVKGIRESNCGDCDLCVQACPARAATGAMWHSGLDRDAFFDPHKCRAFAREVSAQNLKMEISLCGICIAACPHCKDVSHVSCDE